MLGDHAYLIADHLKKPTLDREFADTGAASHPQATLAQQRHEGRVARQNADFTVECRRGDGICFAVEHSRLRRDDRDPHHELESFLAFSTASSIVPTM